MAAGTNAMKSTMRAAAEALNARGAASSSQSRASAGGPVGMRSRIDLAGTWERHVEGKLLDFVEVPSSLHPFGYYRLKRDFLLPRLAEHERVVAHFDAINYHGRVFVNGSELGTSILYVPHEFEFTKQAKEGTNHIEVAIADLVPEPGGAGKDEIALGVNAGWEAYGGIVHDAYLELRPPAYIENAQLGYSLAGNFAKADCRVRVFLSSALASAGNVRVRLLEGETEVARAEKAIEITPGATEAELAFEVQHPCLWSPNEPKLYELRVDLRSGAGEDTWRCRTGFRTIEIRASDFLLNGERLVLNGVCRHDMWKDQGFTQTRAQRQQDMRMIKDLGANFVRLVHYPHHRSIVELADELGLLVTEEPGYWGMNFKTMPPSMMELGYQIMERVIRRDWNSPSVFAWLLGNECDLTVSYLRDGKERCRKLDPIARPVSFANSMPPKEAKAIFEQAGMDFFDSHPYPADPREYADTAEVYGTSRPLTFSEWGWETAQGEAIFPEIHTDLLLNLVESHRLAGHSFWSWQDMRQYSRIDWPTQHGILMSGIVNEAREIRPEGYLEMTRLFQERHEEPQPENMSPRVLPLRWAPAQPGSTFQVVDLQPVANSPEANTSWAALEAALRNYWPTTSMARNQWERTGKRFVLWRSPEVQISGVPFRFPIVDGYARPVVLTSEVPEVTIPVEVDCTQLHILGQVMLPVGYPAVGRRGETAATYTVRFVGGKTREFAVRHGIEVAQANLVQDATRINPIATAAQRALEFVKDVVREQYQVLLWSVPLGKDRVEALHCRLAGRQPALAIFALTAERSR
jgi:hypothetical protein